MQLINDAMPMLNRSANLTPAVMQPVPATNPFGTLPAMPQVSIGRTGTSSSIQYGISSMPVSKDYLAVLHEMITSLLTCLNFFVGFSNMEGYFAFGR